MAEDTGRRRFPRAYKNIQRARQIEFINPMPYMSDAEAMVHLELEDRRIPFSWRYFDGKSPWIEQLLPGYAPEFTLREHRLVIIVVGEYFGTLPGVIDREALAQAALEEDGWKMVSLLSADIKQRGPSDVLNEKAPELIRPKVRGDQRPSPYDPPTYFEELRKRVSAQGLRRRSFALEDPKREKEDDGTTRPYRDRRTNRPRRSRRRYRRTSSG